MRNFMTALSATMTAIVIGLLIANVASAARAADIEHTKAQQLAAIQSNAATNDMSTQLEAYRTRYTQAYEQLAAAYQAYYARDQQYRAVVGRSNANAAELATANAALEAKLNEAYQALRDAQALVASLRAGATQGPAIAPTPSSGTSPTAPPARTPTPPAPTATPARYCWYDAEGHWVCEDHPQGQ